MPGWKGWFAVRFARAEGVGLEEGSWRRVWREEKGLKVVNVTRTGSFNLILCLCEAAIKPLPRSFPVNYRKME